MQPEDISQYRKPFDPRPHPDGTRVAFGLEAIDIEENRYDRQIWLWDGDRARQFTNGPGDRLARWSPDGSKLAFARASAGKDSPTAIMVMNADGGDPEPVAEVALGVTQLEWSPDGSSLAAIVVTWAPELAELTDDERAERPRIVEHMAARFDNEGWRIDRRRRLLVVDLDGELHWPFAEDEEQVALAWHPRGERIAVITPVRTRIGLDPNQAVVEVDVTSGNTTVVQSKGSWDAISYRPDGRLHLVGDPDVWAHPGLSSLWRMDEGGPADLTGHADRSVWSLAVKPAPDRPLWSNDTTCLCVMEDSGQTVAVAVDADGTVERLTSGPRVVTGVAPGVNGAVHFVASTSTNPGELFVLDGGDERQLTDFNGQVADSLGLVEPIKMRVETADGVDVDAWVLLPPGDGPVPVLLNIHGGPASQYGDGFFDEFQVFAGAGFGVVACNPRGSSGRGREFVRAVLGEGWGVNDLHDVMAVVDAALADHPRLDGDRMGIMGGSYGGFLTAWTIARSDRFRSAVVERALIDWRAFGATSDIGGYFSRMYLDADLGGDEKRLAEASPLTAAGDIETPTLIVHSELDYRCPIEQAELLFGRLYRKGIPVRMIRFPGESHELSRSGKPRHRVQRFEHILAWHAHHLAGSAGADDLPE